ncbi:hypothetical protein AeMF1_007825, partial [Aphanomyces euteiches]
MSQVLPMIVQPEQNGFVKGRRIHDHVIFLQDLQHHCTTFNQEAYAMLLDFEKAYDRVNHEFMFAVLKKFNVGDQFIEWVKLLYNQTQVSLNINGTLTDPFYPSRGVKQGDPLSSMLFVLTIEPLAQMLRNHPEYGYAFSDSGIASVLLFADDTTLISSSVGDLESQLELVDEFCRHSGAKLNRNKSKVLTLDNTQS